MIPLERENSILPLSAPLSLIQFFPFLSIISRRARNKKKRRETRKGNSFFHPFGIARRRGGFRKENEKKKKVQSTFHWSPQSPAAFAVIELFRFDSFEKNKQLTGILGVYIYTFFICGDCFGLCEQQPPGTGLTLERPGYGDAKQKQKKLSHKNSIWDFCCYSLARSRPSRRLQPSMSAIRIAFSPYISIKNTYIYVG